jgi:hypothetical protein
MQEPIKPKFKVGDRVAIVHPRQTVDREVKRASVVRVGKRDVVLDDGTRTDLDGLVRVEGMRDPFFGKRIEVVS